MGLDAEANIAAWDINNYSTVEQVVAKVILNI